MINCIKNSYGTIDKNVEIGPIQWPHFDLIFIHSGQIQLNLVDTTVEIDSSQAILIYPKTCFQGGSATPTSKISVHHFSLDNNDNLPTAMVSLLDKNNGHKIYQPTKVTTLEQDIERIISVTHENALLTNKDIRSALMILIISELQSITNQKMPKLMISPELKKLITWLNENLANNITLDDMANFMHLSTSHFRAGFRRQTGISPGNYLSNMRINKAAKLLRETLTPIKQIAKITGYRDITYFYHVFQKFYNMTPKIYRNQHLPLG